MTYDATAENLGTERRKTTTRFLQGRQKGFKKEAEDIRNKWAKEPAKRQAPYFSSWQKLTIPAIEELQRDFTLLPPGSWAIQFTFTLATPYLSKGIEAFDLLDNAIIRDKAYEVPIVPASSWKGGLRAAALVYFGGDDKALTEQQREQMKRLFGNPKKAEADFSAGRLHCFPTGFDATTCQVINPHDRARRVGVNPILLECVPEGRPGAFTALYVPFGVVQPGEAADDLTLCAQAIQDLLLQWGIGAKKSNGNGLAKDGITNLYLGSQKSTDMPEPQLPTLPDICRAYEARFGTDYQTMKPNDWTSHDGATKADYRAAREAFQAYKHQKDDYPRLHDAWEQRPQVRLSLVEQAKLSGLVATVEAHLIPTLMEETH